MKSEVVTDPEEIRNALDEDIKAQEPKPSKYLYKIVEGKMVKVDSHGD